MPAHYGEARKRKEKKPKKKLSAWNVFLKAYVKAHPNLSLGEASHKASEAYKKKK